MSFQKGFAVAVLVIVGLWMLTGGPQELIHGPAPEAPQPSFIQRVRGFIARAIWNEAGHQIFKEEAPPEVEDATHESRLMLTGPPAMKPSEFLGSHGGQVDHRGGW